MGQNQTALTQYAKAKRKIVNNKMAETHATSIDGTTLLRYRPSRIKTVPAIMFFLFSFSIAIAKSILQLNHENSRFNQNWFYIRRKELQLHPGKEKKLSPGGY